MVKSPPKIKRTSSHKSLLNKSPPPRSASPIFLIPPSNGKIRWNLLEHRKKIVSKLLEQGKPQGSLMKKPKSKNARALFAEGFTILRKRQETQEEKPDKCPGRNLGFMLNEARN